jgi:hypothetical protein
MDFVKFVYDGRSYNYAGSNSLKMAILGSFLSSDASTNISSYKDWAVNSPNLSACGNLTSLNKKNERIFLSDLYSEEAFPTEIEIKLTQFIKLLDDWHSKVSEKIPKEVTINFNNDIFAIETSE